MKTKLSKLDLRKAKEEQIPVVEVSVLAHPKNDDDCTRVKFWCPWCFKHHTHGMDHPVPFKISHRIAHCDESTPLSKRGYYIFLAG